MKVTITEYLRIDMATERWECRRCEHELGAARENYKQGLLVYDRDPREIHPPLLNPRLYARTYTPDPAWCRILEYYCPNCGTMIEVEYLPPGHPPLHDIEFDIDALKSRLAAGEFGEAPPASAAASPPRGARAAHRHSH